MADTILTSTWRGWLSPTRVTSALLQHAQQASLRGGRDVADFIQEQCTTMVVRYNDVGHLLVDGSPVVFIHGGALKETRRLRPEVETLSRLGQMVGDAARLLACSERLLT